MYPRSQSMARLKIAMSAPSRPRIASAGTRQPSKTSSLMGEVRSPIFRAGGPTVSPGASRSTRKADSPANPNFGSVEAKTTNRPPTGALVMKVFDPSRT
jgi:hypothetical protein